MRVAGVAWDRENLAHLRERGRCQVIEVEDVLLSRCHPSSVRAESREPGDEPRFRVRGQTCTGRHLCVIVAPLPGGRLRPITCWPLEGRALRTYLGWRKTVKR